jgi:hypothetical protein
MSSFDPFEQNVTMIIGQGAILNIPMADIDEYAQEGLVYAPFYSLFSHSFLLPVWPLGDIFVLTIWR